MLRYARLPGHEADQVLPERLFRAIDSNFVQAIIHYFSIHITGDDTYKASFTLEQGTAYMRACGTHDWLDKNS